MGIAQNNTEYMLPLIEKVVIDAPSETIGSVIEKMGRRKGEMIDMKPGEGDFTRVEFLIPARRTYRI